MRETAVPTHHDPARQQTKNSEWESGANPEGAHDNGDPAEVLSSSGDHRGGTQSRSDARAPDDAEEKPERELPAQARNRKTAEMALGPATEGSRGKREPNLH